uniref:Uncharacterized protein n=5 Tax=Meloidogyne TaxID=189290 RepID=A0A6V7XW80_MELEN|nr:unnamed protein product [Meloidogyne enterolobii]
MAPHLESNWEHYIQHVKFWRTEVKRSLGEMISNLEIVSSGNGKPTIFGLAAAPGDSSFNQILMHAEICLDDLPLNSDDLMEERPILELKPMFDFAAKIQPQTPSKDPSTDDQQQSKLPSELALHYERLRGQLSSGVVSYERHAENGAFLICTFTQLFVYKNNIRSQIAQWLPPQSFLMNASFCKITSDFVAFISGNQLFIDRNGIRVFKSDNSLPNTSNGVPSFITQEEFERYDGYWWSPTRVEILYERVDESQVGQIVPGGCGGESMRYPLAGTKNAISMPRICCLVNCEDEENCSFDDLGLDNNLNEFVPWMEYIVRMGWTSKGNEIYLVVMNRLQTRMAIILLPRTLFVSAGKNGKGFGNMKIIYEETSTVWINWNNLLHFPLIFNQTDECEKKQIQFIMGSESSDKCHLYLQNWEEEKGIISKQITRGSDWVVLKEAVPKVDNNRQLVYFLAERISPIILSLCVASIPSVTSTTNNEDKFNDCRVLTPQDLSYKFERCNPTLCLNPDVGFICWLSAVNRLPECRFYRFVHGNEPGLLPTAIYTHRIGVQIVSPSPSICSTSSWGLSYLHRSPSSIFKHKFCEFESTTSKQRHFALALWPCEEIESSKKFPIIHSVYGGPSIQIVRNSWHSISQFLKFLAYGYAVVIVDGRGSANRGVSFEGHIKEAMGSVEMEDQVEGLKQAIDQTGNILDGERVVCIGWSYGGYMSIQLIAEYPNVYKAAVVGGAVTDWQLYDTAYTERYMGTPQQNAEAYKKSSVISKVDMLPNQEGRILIVHGMIDENVHFQHTILLINSLIKASKPHQLLLFPTERHAIRTGESVEYFHASVLSFFRRALGLGIIVKKENI